MNSFKMIEKALEYEVERQTEMLDNGEKIIQETRGWNDAKGKTLSQRSKEEANDYRYFPEPDLPPIDLKAENAINLDEIRNLLPELPKEKRIRFEAEYGLNKKDAETLTSDVELAKYFEEAIESLNDDAMANTEVLKGKAKKITNWIASELLGRMNKYNVQLSEVKIKSKDIADLVSLIDDGKISGKQAKDVFDEMFETGDTPEKIVEKSGMGQISGTEELEQIINEVLQSNEGPVNDYKNGKQQAFGFLVGQVMAKTKGQANPKIVNDILREKLK
jgi:aspartyl-tRNA(Asn)/glutamyl-tRNA(Gln) amidotransferase subunit B